jgi:hypothetical protein
VRRATLFTLVALLSLLGVVSCPNNEDLSHALTIVNNSSREIEKVGLGYTGIKAPAADLEVAVTVPVGETKTVDLTLDSSSEYYVLFVWNDTDSKRILWDGTAGGDEYVLLSKGGSSTCTVTDAQLSTFAGENDVNPYSYNW